MKRLIFSLLLLAQFAFANDDNSTDSSSAPAPRRLSPPISRGPAPTITVNDREMSITLPKTDSMRITLFTPRGRRLTRKKIVGETVTFRLPRAAKKEVIVQIEAGAMRFFSQSVILK